MTKFSTLPPLGADVTLAGRTVRMPSVAQMERIRDEAKPFYPWYSLCPIQGDIITVDTRPGELFLVESAGSTISRDRWICQVRQITGIDDAGVLAFGHYVEWIIKLPRVTGETPGDECAIDALEIIGQAQSVFQLLAPLPS